MPGILGWLFFSTWSRVLLSGRKGCLMPFDILRRRDVCGRYGGRSEFKPNQWCTTPAGAGRVAGSVWEPKGLSMCTVDLWKHRDSMEHCSGDFLSWSEQFGGTTATGFDNEPLKHISNIVTTIMFLQVAFGVPRSRRWRLY